MVLGLLISILILLGVCVFFFLGILMHKRYIKYQDGILSGLRKANCSLIEQLRAQTKETIKARNELLLLQEEFKKFKRH